jgi:ArsR family transcriptional regulator
MICLAYFKALADETRIRLLNILMHHELSVNEIVTLMAMGQSRISRHLKILTDSGLLECRRDGAWAFYSAAGNSTAGRFVKRLGPVFKTEPQLSGDIENAARLVAERSVRTRNFFNSIAPRWNDLRQKVLGDFDLNQALLERTPPCRFAVDLGCGTGGLLSGLRKKADFAVGVDSSRKMLDQAENLLAGGKPNVELRLGELEHLPVGNSEADLAVLSMVLHHLPDPAKVVREAARILESGGIFIIADFDKHTNEDMRKQYGDRWLGFSREEITAILENTAFEHLETISFELNPTIHLNITTARKKS